MKGIHLIMSYTYNPAELLCHGGSEDGEIAKAIFRKVCQKYGVDDVVINKCLTKQPVQYKTVVRCIYITPKVSCLETLREVEILK